MRTKRGALRGLRSAGGYYSDGENHRDTGAQDCQDSLIVDWATRKT